MPYFNPSAPRQPRITVPQSVEENVEFNPPMIEETAPVLEQTAPAVVPVMPEEPSPVTDGLEPSTSETSTEPDSSLEKENSDVVSDAGQQKPKKKAGRPKGSTSKATAATATPASPVKPVNQQPNQDTPADKKIRTSVYLTPKDRKRLGMLCVDPDAPMTHFIEDACTTKMYSSYCCTSPSCGCEFTIKTPNADAKPSCPLCGEQKLTRPYLLEF